PEQWPLSSRASMSARTRPGDFHSVIRLRVLGIATICNRRPIYCSHLTKYTSYGHIWPYGKLWRVSKTHLSEERIWSFLTPSPRRYQIHGLVLMVSRVPS